MPKTSLLQYLVAYLEETGWYQDDEWQLHDEHEPWKWGWTRPEWDEYWENSRTGIKSRRHENFYDAVSSQLLREERPNTYACFYAPLMGKKNG